MLNFRKYERSIYLSLFLCLISAVALAQEIVDVPFDTVVERAEAWENLSADRVTIAVDTKHTHGTPKALHMRWKKDLGDIAGKGIPKTPQVPRCWLELPKDLDLSKFTRLSFWARIEGTRHGHLHVCFGNMKTLWGKGAKRHINNTPLDAGDWSRYTVTIGQIPAEERATYRWMCIASINVGYQPDEKPVMDVWLDDFKWTSKPLRKWEGWDADPSVVIVSQLGFRRFHEKIGIVNGKSTAKDFEVRAVPGDAIAFKGRLKIIRSAVGMYKIADFTRLTKPGRYVVHAGDVKSLEFRIGDDVYKPCIALLSDWIFNMRCGCKTALHAPCHTDDATFVRYEGRGKERKELSREHLDLAGGWHDAGDVRTYYSYTVWMAHQCLRARESGWWRDRDGDGVDDLMDSAVWAMKHLAKIVNPDTGELFWKVEDWPDYRRGNYWTDNKVGTPDDRHVMHPPENVAAVGRACASAGLFARRARTKYPKLAKAALDIAEDRWAAWFSPEGGKIRWRQERMLIDHGHGYNVAKVGQGSLQLYLATKKPVYLEFAKHCAEMIMSYQRRTFYPGGPRPMCGEIFSWMRSYSDRDLPEEFLADMMIELPDDPDYYKWRATLVRTAEWWMKRTRHFWRPFSVPQLEVPSRSMKEGFFTNVALETSPDEGTLRYLLPTAYRQQYADTAQALHRVAQALNDVELERLTRTQVQWAVGHNPFNVSWICRYGEDYVDQFYSFSQGRMPGCVSGFGIKNDGIPRCVRPYDGESYTQPGVRLLRAMVGVGEPARLRLYFQRGNSVCKGKVQIKWKETGEVVFEDTINANGFVPSIEIDGGERYELLCNGVNVPLDVVSGTQYDKSVNLGKLLVLSAGGAERVKAKEAFTIKLSVANRGKDTVTTTITVHADDAETEATTKTVKVDAGKTEVIDWPFTAGEGNRPYILFFEPDGDRAAGLDVTGAILP